MTKLGLVGLALLPTFALAAEPAAQANVSQSGPLTGYRSFKDEPVAPWRTVNDNVGRIGGWKVYAKERSDATAPPSAPAAAPSDTPNAGAAK